MYFFFLVFLIFKNLSRHLDLKQFSHFTKEAEKAWGLVVSTKLVPSRIEVEQTDPNNGDHLL